MSDRRSEPSGTCGGEPPDRARPFGVASRGCGCDGEARHGGGRDASRADPRLERWPVGASPTARRASEERAAPGVVGGHREPGGRVPIGARSAVPVPAGFDGVLGALPLAPSQVAQWLFHDAGDEVRRRAIDWLEQFPSAALRRVYEQLANLPAAYRLSRLHALVRRDPSMAPLDPTLAVTEVALQEVPVPRPTLPAATPPVCSVNGFDPQWGPPPASAFGVPLRFDAAKGWYDFNRLDALARVAKTAFGEPVWDRLEFHRLASAYDEGYALQPFRRALGSPWEHRFVLRNDRGAPCDPYQPTSYATDG